MLDRVVTTMPAVAAPNMGWASTEAASRSLGLGLWLAVGIITGFGFSLRFYCAANDLWTDEIWSLQLVQDLRSPAEVFWGISHDNNHYLNSLWLYGLPATRPVCTDCPPCCSGRCRSLWRPAWGYATLGPPVSRRQPWWRPAISW